MNFKCSICQESVHMKKEVPSPFSDWAYAFEWSDFDENVPVLTEQHWTRSDRTPEVGESRTVRVKAPFDEEIGDVFHLLYEPAMVYLNGWDEYPEEIDACALVRCRFEKVLLSDAYSAWITVRVLDVIPLDAIHKAYPAIRTDAPLEGFDGIRNYRTEFRNDRWLLTGWTGQGDVGEMKWVYTDDAGVRHLVMMYGYAFHEDVFYIGNIVNGISQMEYGL